jgi:lipocalin-like protein
MRSIRVIGLALVASALLAASLAWSQGGNPPASTKESGETSGHGMTAVEQTGKSGGNVEQQIAAEPTGGQPKPSNPLIGAWRLVSVEDHRPPDVLFALGPNPRGMIIYTATGKMAVQITRAPQSHFSSGYNKAAPEEIRTAYEGYYAYFGTYDVDFDKRIVTHHLEASLRPMEVGENYQRAFELSDDRLVLIPIQDGKQQPARLTWERVK